MLTQCRGRTKAYVVLEVSNLTTRLENFDRSGTVHFRQPLHVHTFAEKCFCSKDDRADEKYLVLSYVERYCSTVVEITSYVLQNPNERVDFNYLTFNVPCGDATEKQTVCPHQNIFLTCVKMYVHLDGIR